MSFLNLNWRSPSKSVNIFLGGVAGAKPPQERVARNEVRARGRLSPPYENEKRK